MKRGIRDVIYERRWLWLFLAVFALVFIRYCYFGFEYYYQLDDYIQYHNNPGIGGSRAAAVAALGLLGARPLAGLSDIMVWSHFYDSMLLAVALISAMYAASAVLFQKVFKRLFGTGGLFVVVYALLPLGLEGTYWVSASSRAAVGLFFAAAALYFFDRWCRGAGRRFLPLYAVSQLLAYGFYEQVLVFSLVSVMLAAILHFREKRPRAYWGFLSFLNAAVYFIFTRAFSEGSVYAERMELVVPWGSYYFENVLPAVLAQLRDAYLGGGFYTLAKGFYRGAGLLLTQPNALYVLALLFLCAVLFLLLRPRRGEAGEERRYAGAIVAGLVLAIAPSALFFIIGGAWISLRATVASFCGLALVVDALFALLVSRAKAAKTVTAAAAAILALIFCVASVSEIHDYRRTTIDDQRAVSQIIGALKRDGYYRAELKVGILGLEPSYLEDQNYYYHEHIHGVTESWWALTGAVECFGGAGRPAVTPLPSDPLYQPWNRDASRLGGFDVLYLYADGGLLRVTAVHRGEEYYELYDDAGGLVGHTWEENEYGYLALE